MPLPLANSPTVPNALLVPAITIMTTPRTDETGARIPGIVTAAHLQLQAAAVDEAGQWTPIEPVRANQIDDIENLPEDLAALTATVDLGQGPTSVPLPQAVLMAAAVLLAVVAAVNEQRKIV
ncbi:MAG: hypothetical protein NT031_11195 [Planctomycetota bacterium]|nr:hypothetical protein [Planctomycetota bacterium]